MSELVNLLWNWWNSVPQELNSSIDSVISDEKKEAMKNYIASHAGNLVARAKIQGKPILVHPNDALLRSLVVTPQGDFFLLLNRHNAKEDKVLGQGANGKVSIAIHLNTGEKYVSKRCYSLYAEDKEAIQVQLTNNQAMESLGGCTHIACSVDYESSKKHDGIPKTRLISKLSNEGSLEGAILSGRLTDAEKIQVMKDLCPALNEMHEIGLVHRDIKPGNILLHNGRALITDFDTSGKIGMIGDSVQDMVIGTPPYVAPEVTFRDQKSIANQDDRADVYALGVSFLKLFGKKIDLNPISQKMEYHQAVLAAAKELGDAPHLQLIQKMVAIDPEERITSGELAEAIQGV